MVDVTVELVIFAALLVHGIGHVGALGTLAVIAYRPGMSTGNWKAARSWLVPSLPKSAAAAVASVFWMVSLVGFVLVALGWWGVLLPDLWRPLAIVSAMVSAGGIVLFFRTWPVFNTAAALGMNIVAVILALFWPV